MIVMKLTCAASVRKRFGERLEARARVFAASAPAGYSGSAATVRATVRLRSRAAVLGPLARDEHGDQRAGGDGDRDDRELEDQQAPGEAPHPHRRMIPRSRAIPRDHKDTFNHNDHKHDSGLDRPYVRPPVRGAGCRGVGRDERACPSMKRQLWFWVLVAIAAASCSA